MRQATISILGLYRYDSTLFDNFQIPEALDKTVLIDNLLLECAELEVLYPDLDFLKFIIGRWSEKSLPVWDKLYKTTVLEYDPIENYNRIEEWEETGTGSATETGTDTTAGTSSRKLTRTGNIGTNTFQNLLQQERNIWMYDFFEQVFKDVDSVLTIPIY